MTAPDIAAGEKPGPLAWEITPAGMAVLIALLCFGALSGVWAALRRDTFQSYFEGYVRAGSETARRSYHAKFKQTAPADANARLLAIVEAPGSSVEERRAATELIGESGSTSLFPVLQRLSRESGDAPVRSAAIIAMGGIPGAEARTELAALARSPENSVRLDALRAVEMHHRDDLADVVRERIEAGDDLERLAAVQAAASVRGMEVDLVRTHLSDPSARVRLAAAQGLRRLPRTELVSALGTDLLEGSWVPVRPELPRRRTAGIQRQLESSFLLMIEDALGQLQEGETDIPCTDEDCRMERNFYRDLLRRRSQVKMELEGFQRGKRPLYFASGVWSSGGRPRYAMLALVLPADHRDAVFPVRSVPVENRPDAFGADGRPKALGEVVSVSGNLRDDSIRLEVLEADGAVSLYSFRNGVFMQAAAPGTEGAPSNGNGQAR